MNAVLEARFYEPPAEKKVLRTLPPHDCRIPDNGRGACRVRYNRGGRLYNLVYEGNVPGEGGEITHCRRCDALLVERFGFFLRRNRIRGGRCPDCGSAVDGLGMSGA
jgi:hypothetical protein